MLSHPFLFKVMAVQKKTVPTKEAGAKMVHTVSKELSFESEGFTGTIDIDDLTSIHSENLEGEFLTVTRDLTKIGFLKSRAEDTAKKAKMQLEYYSAKFNSDTRREAAANNNYFLVGDERVKLTENSAKEAMQMDDEWRRLATAKIEAETNFEMISMVYWSLSQKSGKLDKLVYNFNKDK